MSTINLLPEKLRRKEEQERERLAKKPRVFEVELSKPKSGKAKLGSDEPKPSLFARIFGTKKKKTPVVAGLSGQKLPVVKNRHDVNLLSSKRKLKIKHKKAKKGEVVVHEKPAKARRFSFAGLLGPARSPIKPSDAKQPTPSIAKEIKIKPVEEHQPKSKKPSFWSGLFGRKKRIKPAMTTQPPMPKKEAPHRAPDLPSIKIDRASKKAKKIKPEKRSKGTSLWDSFGALFSRPKKIRKDHLEPPKKITTKAEKPKKKSKRKRFKFHLAPRVKKRLLDINLIPEELLFKKQANVRAQIVKVCLAIIIPATMVYGSYYLLDLYQENIYDEIVKKQETVAQLQERVKFKETIKQKNVILYQKLLALKGVMDGHVYWSKFFGLLEKYTLDTVYYSEFSIDVSGSFSLPAVAVSASGDHYAEAAKQVVLFEEADEFIAEVIVDNMSVQVAERGGIAGVGLDFRVKLADQVFYKNE